jgi:hypothetical protein
VVDLDSHSLVAKVRLKEDNQIHQHGAGIDVESQLHRPEESFELRWIGGPQLGGNPVVGRRRTNFRIAAIGPGRYPIMHIMSAQEDASLKLVKAARPLEPEAPPCGWRDLQDEIPVFGASFMQKVRQPREVILGQPDFDQIFADVETANPLDHGSATLFHSSGELFF